MQMQKLFFHFFIGFLIRLSNCQDVTGTKQVLNEVKIETKTP
jgi:hypothetical protein